MRFFIMQIHPNLVSILYLTNYQNVINVPLL